MLSFFGMRKKKRELSIKKCDTLLFAFLMIKGLSLKGKLSVMNFGENAIYEGGYNFIA